MRARLLLVASLLAHLPGSCPAGKHGDIMSKMKLRDQLRAELQVLRADRESGKLSEVQYRERKEMLRDLGKTGKTPVDVGNGERWEKETCCDASLRQSPSPQHRHSIREPSNKKQPEIPIPTESVTWHVVKQSRRIDSIEDPVTGCPIGKHKFESIFAKMLQELNGEGGYEDSYIDFYFERDVLNMAVLRFVSEERKAEWMDWAEDLGIQPSLEEIKAGETKEEKATREQAEQRQCNHGEK